MRPIGRGTEAVSKGKIVGWLKQKCISCVSLRFMLPPSSHRMSFQQSEQSGQSGSQSTRIKLRRGSDVRISTVDLTMLQLALLPFLRCQECAALRTLSYQWKQIASRRAQYIIVNVLKEALFSLGCIEMEKDIVVMVDLTSPWKLMMSISTFLLKFPWRGHVYVRQLRSPMHLDLPTIHHPAAGILQRGSSKMSPALKYFKMMKKCEPRVRCRCLDCRAVEAWFELPLSSIMVSRLMPIRVSND